MTENFQFFLDWLADASAAIDPTYFWLAVSGSTEPIIRERAYAYELFHQLRLALPDEFPFHLHGEVDKRGHPELGECLGGRNPDLILHIPGEAGPGANLAVVEIKRATSRATPVTKDADTLQRFLMCADYHAGVLLLYGGEREDARAHVREALVDSTDFGSRIHVFWHPRPGDPLETINWLKELRRPT